MWCRTSNQQWIWCYRGLASNNRLHMDLTDAQIEELEHALQQLEQLDPASLPGPAAELADLLSRILDELEAT